MVVICCSNDIPAARKLCGYISALAAYHRCYKTTNISQRKSNFARFDDMDDWFIQKDLNKYRQNAENWQLCKSNNERDQHVSDTQVR